MWSEEHQCWLDLHKDRHIEVFTPTIWWPVFVGAVTDLHKIRAVIENYLLNPEKFWGDHGIPSVAFDDRTYNEHKDGYYWCGQIWMINNYAALEVLYRYGYEKEAEELQEKVMKTVYSSQGLFETYNALTGAVGWSSRGPGDPAVMQFGMSSAWVTQIVFKRYQHFRYITPETIAVDGYIQWAAECCETTALSPPGAESKPKNALLHVSVAGEKHHQVPRISLKSLDNSPLLEAERIKLKLESPKGLQIKDNSIRFTWRDKVHEVAPGEYILKPGGGAASIENFN